MYPIYDYIEKRLALCGELIRSSLIHTDIVQYARQGHTITESELYYFDWMSSLAQKSNQMLLSEVYVEWLKDIYGGQMIAKHVRYNTSLKFNDIKQSAMNVRSMITLPEESEDCFISAVNTTYNFHYNLMENIMA